MNRYDVFKHTESLFLNQLQVRETEHEKWKLSNFLQTLSLLQSALVLTDVKRCSD